jgi:hypothetical protein
MICLLCDSPHIALRGVFIPYRGKPASLAGRPVIMPYVLCRHCHRKRDWMQRVDKKLLKELKMRAAAGNN